MQLPQRPGQIPQLGGRRAHELQHRHRKAFFGYALFDIFPFKLAELGIQQIFVAFDVLLMGA